MKKILLIAVSITTLTGCYKEAEKKEQTTNSKIEIELLFEVDGCKVYRFLDGGYKYFTTCKGSISWENSNGKARNEQQINTCITK